MKYVRPRVFGACPAHQLYRLVYMAQKEMTQPQCRVMASARRVVRVEPYGFFQVRDSRARFTEPHHRLPKLEVRAGVAAVERNRRLELHLRFMQADLISPNYPHRMMRTRAV